MAVKSKTETATSTNGAVSIQHRIVKPLWMRTEFLIRGDAPLIVDRMQAKALISPPPKPKTVAEYEACKNQREIDCRYPVVEGCDGFPAGAFKKAMASAAKRFFDQDLVRTYGMLRVPTEYLPIFSPGYTMREDTGKNWNARGAAIVIYRPAYTEWEMKVPVIYWANEGERDRDHLSVDDVASILLIAGQSVGIGSRRPEKGGDFGTFQVVRFTSPEPYVRYPKQTNKEEPHAG